MFSRPAILGPRRAAALALAFSLSFRAAPAVDLFLSPSHADSCFIVLGRCRSEATLVNVDFHDDLAANRRSRELRRAWFAPAAEGRAGPDADRAGTGVACWNWIEPLMPFPVSRAVWVAPPGAADESSADLGRKLKLGKRFDGLAPERFALADFAKALPRGPWILSIDLDYLCRSDDPEGDLRWLLDRCAGHPPEVAVAAVSMPYLPSEAMAGRLVRALASAIAAEPGWRFLVDPAEPVAEAIDRKRRDELRKEGREWKEYDPRADGLAAFIRDGPPP